MFFKNLYSIAHRIWVSKEKAWSKKASEAQARTDKGPEFRLRKPYSGEDQRGNAKGDLNERKAPLSRGWEFRTSCPLSAFPLSMLSGSWQPCTSSYTTMPNSPHPFTTWASRFLRSLQIQAWILACCKFSMCFRTHSLFRRQTEVSYLNYCLKLVNTSDTTQRQILSRGIFHDFFLDKRGKG